MDYKPLGETLTPPISLPCAFGHASPAANLWALLGAVAWVGMDWVLTMLDKLLRKA